MTVFILGGGPSGLAVADGLADNGADKFMLFERGERLGGLAQSVPWVDVGTHDLGPHKIFTLDEVLMRRVSALLPDAEWLQREKISSIYMKGYCLPYPPSPFSLAGVFGLPAFVRMVAGYGFARLSALTNSRAPATFEEDLTGRLGYPLYNALFKPIALKLWGDPMRLDVNLSKGRVQTPSLAEVIARLLKLKSSSRFEALHFSYPKGGLGRIWEAIQVKAARFGEFNLQHSVMGFACENGAISTIQTRNDVTGELHDVPVTDRDFVVSTLPMARTVELFGSVLPADIATTAGEFVALNDLLLVFLHVDSPNLIKDSWVFVPDPEIIFHRLSEQESFDPGMTPNGSIVCCEIMSSDLRPMATKSDPELVNTAIADLRKMGHRGFKAQAAKVIRLPRSYPVYRTGYGPGLKRVLGALDGIRNFRSIGRQGAFNYIGTLDAMDTGYGFSRWFLDRHPKSWEAERLRTSHYPVLD